MRIDYNHGVTICFADRQYACLPARDVTDHFSCSPSGRTCPGRTVCTYAALFNDSALVRLTLINRTVLHVGNVRQVSHSPRRCALQMAAGLGVSNFVPRFGRFLPPMIPDGVRLLLQYIVAFSSALALLNAVPCCALDGQHLAAVVVEVACGNSRRSRWWLRAVLAYGTTVLAGNVAVRVGQFARTLHCAAP